MRLDFNGVVERRLITTTHHTHTHTHTLCVFVCGGPPLPQRHLGLLVLGSRGLGKRVCVNNKGCFTHPTLFSPPPSSPPPAGFFHSGGGAAAAAAAAHRYF